MMGQPIWLTVFVTIAVLLAVTPDVNADPCYNHIEIDEPERSTNYMADPNLPDITLLCDDDLVGYQWYRFVSGAGGQMTTRTGLPEYSCGTRHPVYMTGNHPTAVNQTVQTNACTQLFNIDCFNQYPMEVKKCDGYYVYRLQSVVCPSAYCAGTEVRCDKGENSRTGFTPGCAAYPEISGPPTVTADVVDRTYSDWTFKTPILQCKFHSEDNNADQTFFNVTWFVDNENVSTDVLIGTMGDGGDYVSTLDQFRHPIGSPNVGLYSLGQHLRCSVVSAYVWANVTSPELTSNNFFAGITVYNTSVTVEENGEPVSLAFSSSIPVKCDNYIGCKVEVGLDVDKQIKEQHGHLNMKDCIVELDSDYQVDSLKYLDIVSQPTAVSEDSDIYVLNFTTNEQNDPYYFRHYKPGHVVVHRIGMKSGTCASTGDPHFLTFDGSYYDWYRTGDYVMVREKRTEGEPFNNFEVHVRLKKCFGFPWNPSCNCAIAVREGNEVAIADGCNRDHGFIYTRITDPDNCNPSFNVTISPNGRDFQVTTPSGQLVRFIDLSGYFDVYVDVNGAMYDRVEGLCGSFDGDQSNDFHYFDTTKNANVADICRPAALCCSCIARNFSLSHKIPRGSSLFYIDKFIPSEDYMTKDYVPMCQCLPKDGDDPEDGSTVYCQETFGEPVRRFTESVPRYTCNHFKRKRSIDQETYSDEDAYDPYAYEIPDEETIFDPDNFTWPTPSGVSEDDARRFCTDAIFQSNIAEGCQEADESREATVKAINDCMFDILLMDDLSVTNTARSMVESVCVSTFSRNSSLWETNDYGELVPPASIVSAVCPDNCNGNGNCTINGTCVCSEGYTAVDCSIQFGVPPEIEAVSSGSRCDVRKRPCERLTIFATGLLYSDDLTCHIHDLEYRAIDNSWIETGSVTTTAADFASAYTAYCYLPVPRVRRQARSIDEVGVSTQAMNISISNDGAIESNPVFVLTYDSLCFNCSESGDCVRKNDACFINGKCYEANEKSPFDDCLHCHVGTSLDDWTEIKDGACSPTTTVQNPKQPIDGNGRAWWLLPVVIGVPLCTLVLFGTITVILLNKKKRVNKKNVVYPLQDISQSRQPNSGK